MFCKYFETSKINPEDFLQKSAIHKTIELKDNKNIHLLHINADRNDKISKKYFEQTINHTKSKLKPSNQTDKEFKNTNSFVENFKSHEFKSYQKNKINFLDGFDTLGFSMAYKDTLKIELSQSEQPLLFLIHGVGGSSLIWRNQINYFGELGYEMIAIDLIGHGESTISNNKKHYEFLEMCLDVLSIFDMFCKKDNIIIGHSYGCSFAVYLSQIRHDLIRKVILISGGLPYPLNFSSNLLKMPLSCFRILKPLINCHFFCSAFSSYCFNSYDSDAAFQISSKALFYTMNGQFWRPSINRLNSSIVFLLIEGENDNFVPLNEAFEMFKIVKSSYLVIIKKGSHMIILEKHDIINKLMNIFINDCFS